MNNLERELLLQEKQGLLDQREAWRAAAAKLEGDLDDLRTRFSALDEATMIKLSLQRLVMLKALKVLQFHAVPKKYLDEETYKEAINDLKEALKCMS